MMKRILPLSLLVVLSLGAAQACKDSSNDGKSDGTSQEQDPNQPGGAGGAAPGVTEDELNTNPIEGIEPVVAVLPAGQFTDGPVWHAGMGVLFFSTPLGEGGLYRMLPDGRVLELRKGNRATGAVPVGNTVTAAGDLITVEMKRVTRMVGGQGEPELIADRYAPGNNPPPPNPPADPDAGVVNPPAVDGQFDTLNDAVARKDGTLYVTDPGYYTPDTAANRLYRITPAKEVEVVETFQDVPRPNGIALSPDEKTLYVGFEKPLEGTMPFIRKYIVNEDGSLGEWTKFKEIVPADSSPDGLAVDKAGNVYVAVTGGIEVYRSNGQPWGKLEVPEKPTGMSFGGEDMKTLFITTQGTNIYTARPKLAGISQ